MNHHLTAATALVLTLVLQTLCLGVNSAQAQARDKTEAERKLESLVASMGTFEQRFIKDASIWVFIIKVPTDTPDKVDEIVLRIREVGEGDSKKTLVKAFVAVAKVESNTKIPTTVHRKVSELNDKLLTGNVSGLDGEGVYINGGWLLDNMTDDDLLTYLKWMLLQTDFMKGELKPLFEVEGVKLVD